jgi:hypothetical protein
LYNDLEHDVLYTAIVVRNYDCSRDQHNQQRQHNHHRNFFYEDCSHGQH